MELSAILLARVLGFIETFDLNPRGSIFYPDFVRAIVEHYKFQKYPQSPEQFDEGKGVEFYDGKIGNRVIAKLTIFNTLIVVETRMSTADSKQILEDMLMWAKERFGFKYEPGMIKRFAYISDLTFYSDVPLLSNPPLQRIAEKTSELLSTIWQEPIRFEPLNISIGHDPTSRKNQIAPFTIQRRAETRFSENKYFSEAPLPTDVHIKLLEEFEAATKAASELREK